MTWSSAMKSPTIPRSDSRLSPETLAKTFDLYRQLSNVDAIFDRVIGHHIPASHAVVPRAAGG